MPYIKRQSRGEESTILVCTAPALGDEVNITCQSSASKLYQRIGRDRARKVAIMVARELNGLRGGADYILFAREDADPPQGKSKARASISLIRIILRLRAWKRTATLHVQMEAVGAKKCSNKIAQKFELTKLHVL